jgi:homoserine O-acetyltransferase
MLMRSSPVVELEVPLPGDLAAFGPTTRGIVSGNPSGRLIVALGGISGNRFVGGTPGGGAGWWPGLVGDGWAVDPARYRILGLDYAADSNGRAAPTTLDQARIVCAALDALGAPRAHAIMGASYGGMVALSLAENFPDRVEKIVVISAGAEPHAAATAARELQRRVVALGIAAGAANEALAIARGMAMMTYRTADEFALRFAGGIDGEETLCRSEPGGYLRARGEAFLTTMTPHRFLSLSASIDRHRVDPSRIAAPALLIGAESDQLVPAQQMRDLAAGLPNLAGLHLRESLYGHDMFLKEAAEVGGLAGPFFKA